MKSFSTLPSEILVKSLGQVKFLGQAAGRLYLLKPMVGQNRTLGAPPTASPGPSGASFDVGTALGQYQLIQLLGEGGMGRVFLAEHMKLGRRVAIKLLRPEFAYQPEAVQRFFGEARVVNRINHEHIVEIVDFVDGEGAEKYYVMELLRGQSLRELLDREGALSLARTLHLAEQICDTLAAVHSANVVHRDLKPDNVFLVERAGQKDFVKLLDFGVAKLLDGQSPATSPKRNNQTAAGGLLGTPEYMAPEQLSGKPVDARSDIYSLGIMLFELLTGRKPFLAESFGETVVKHLTEAPPHPNQFAKIPLPTAIDALILKCLQKHPAERPQSMLELRNGLLAPPSAQVRVKRSRRGAWLGLAAGAVCACALVILVVRDPLHWRSPKAPPAALAGVDDPKTVLAAPAIVPAVIPTQDPAQAEIPKREVLAAPTPPPPEVAAEADPPADPKVAELKKKKHKARIDRGGLVDPYGGQ